MPIAPEQLRWQSSAPATVPSWLPAHKTTRSCRIRPSARPDKDMKPSHCEAAPRRRAPERVAKAASELLKGLRCACTQACRSGRGAGRRRPARERRGDPGRVVVMAWRGLPATSADWLQPDQPAGGAANPAATRGVIFFVIGDCATALAELDRRFSRARAAPSGPRIWPGGCPTSQSAAGLALSRFRVAGFTRRLFDGGQPDGQADRP